MLFPSLKNKIFGYVNHNLEAQEWMLKNPTTAEKNPLLNPVVCEKMVNDIHKKYSLDFSYGGWMEDRSFLWKDSYLQESGNFTHLGVDVNVPPGTEVSADFDAVVVKVDSDYPEEGGWGTRVILKHAVSSVYMIYAHLDPKVECKVGDTITRGQIFAKVGKAPHNGNWFPHLHLQTISAEYFDELEESNSWDELDGYGFADEIGLNAKRFRDPMEFVSLID